MTEITLYTGGGVSLSPLYAEGRTESAYVRLVADEGKCLKKGDVTTFCVDVPIADAESWQEVVDDGSSEEVTAEEIAQAISEVFNDEE